MNDAITTKPLRFSLESNGKKVRITYRCKDGSVRFSTRYTYKTERHALEKLRWQAKGDAFNGKLLRFES